MLDLLRSPWPWYVAGPMIGLVVPLVFWYGGKKWGVSSSLQHLCAAALPRKIDYFHYDWWKKGAWHLMMAAGMVLGGFLGANVLSEPDHVVAITDAAHADIAALGITRFSGMMPADLFSWRSLLTVPGVAVILLGGFLVGFGARWANGCTSGHAISGMANLQLSSLVVVIGFFVGGLISAHLLLPLLLGGA